MTVNATVHIVNAAVTPFFTSSSSELAKKPGRKFLDKFLAFKRIATKTTTSTKLLVLSQLVL